MLNYLYGLAGVVVFYLFLLLLQLWNIINISAATWSKLTLTFAIVGLILLVLMGIKYFKQENHINGDGNSLIG